MIVLLSKILILTNMTLTMPEIKHDKELFKIEEVIHVDGENQPQFFSDKLAICYKTIESKAIEVLVYESRKEKEWGQCGPHHICGMT